LDFELEDRCLANNHFVTIELNWNPSFYCRNRPRLTTFAEKQNLKKSFIFLFLTRNVGIILCGSSQATAAAASVSWPTL
jgi:hypothetical protein